MKITIATNKHETEDLPLYFISHCCQLITDELLKIHGSYKKSYQELLKNYQMLLEKNKRNYKYFGSSNEYSDMILSLIIDLERENPFVLYATLLKLANKYNLEYMKLFIYIDYKIKYADSFDYNSKLVFGKSDVKYIIKLLKIANEVQLLKKSKRVTDFLFEKLKNKESDFKDTIPDFIKELEKDVNEIDYFIFQEADEPLNDSSIYDKIAKIDYKKILLSENFQKYIEEDECFNEDGISDFEEYIKNYIEEGLSFGDEIINLIINNKVSNTLLTEKEIKAVSIEDVSLI